METMQTIDRVLLIDDQAIVGEAVRRMIASQGACEYRSVQDPAQAIAVAVEFKPTVILQDIEMPGINGPSCSRSTARTRHCAMSP